MRAHGKSDTNQPEIVKALRQAGCSVATTSAMGNGFPDLVVGRAGVNTLMEIKDPTKRRADQKLKPAQVTFHATWSGQICIVRTIDEALLAVGIAR